MERRASAHLSGATSGVPALFSTEKHTEYCEHCEEGTGTNNRIVIEVRAGPDDHVLDRGYSCALCWTAHVWTDAD